MKNLVAPTLTSARAEVSSALQPAINLVKGREDIVSTPSHVSRDILPNRAKPCRKVTKVATDRVISNALVGGDRQLDTSAASAAVSANLVGRSASSMVTAFSLQFE